MLELIKRNTPLLAERFILEQCSRRCAGGSYEIDTAPDGRIVLRGDCTLSLAAAYGTYLREVCRADISFGALGALAELSDAPAPEKPIRRDILQEQRAFMSHDTYAYSVCFWGWEEWEREIDRMALNGVNLPLMLVGSETVTYFALVELGLARQDAMEFVSGPVFFPHQLVGCLDSYMPMIDISYLEKRAKLGKMIAERERSLGMEPVMQGFFGQVPRKLTLYLRKVKSAPLPSWCRFPTTWRLDPSSAYFAQIGKAFLEKQRSLFGDCRFFYTNPFYQSEPPVKTASYLPATGKAIDSLLSDFREDSVWVMRGECAREALIGDVPRGRLLVWDIDGDRFGENGFFGHDFLLGSRGGVGGRSVLGGKLAALAENRFLSLREKYPNLRGTGFFPEGQVHNAAYNELAMTMLTAQTPIETSKWLREYAQRRYLSDEPCLFNALKALERSCWADDCADLPGSAVCARPATSLRHTAPFDTLDIPYDNKRVAEAAELMLCSSGKGEGYLSDLCDVVRQALSNRATDLCLSALDAYRRKDPRTFESSSNGFLTLLGELDRLMRTRDEFFLDTYLTQASDRAVVKADKGNFELNVLIQLTFWGPVNESHMYDYAWREWGGLIEGYYLVRWRAYFEALANTFGKSKQLSTETRKKIFGRDLLRGTATGKRLDKLERKWLTSYHPSGVEREDTLAVARELIEKYKNRF